MQGTESQRDGAIIIAVIAVIIFAIHNFSSLLSSPMKNMPYGDSRFGSVIVGISGDMGDNGVFYLADGALVSDLLKAADVRNPAVFERDILDIRLSRGKAVVVESCGGFRITEMNNAHKLSLGIPIDINTATVEDFMLIDGIGEKTASQIVQFRDESGKYEKIEDVMMVRGIKEKKFQRLKRYLCVDDVLKK